MFSISRRNEGAHLRRVSTILANGRAGRVPRAFMERQRTELVKEYQADRRAALDRFGQRMPPRKRPRSDGRRGPVMVPGLSGSMFWRVVATVRVSGGFIELGIRFATAKAARIAGFHGNGQVRGAPIRDIRGTSPRSRDRVRKEFRELPGKILRGGG